MDGFELIMGKGEVNEWGEHPFMEKLFPCHELLIEGIRGRIFQYFSVSADGSRLSQERNPLNLRDIGDLPETQFSSDDDPVLEAEYGRVVIAE